MNTRHGGPWDRGSMDSYYMRGRNPHYYKGNTGTSELVTQDKMTKEEIEEYNQGYDENEKNGDFKDWGKYYE